MYSFEHLSRRRNQGRYSPQDSIDIHAIRIISERVSSGSGSHSLPCLSHISDWSAGSSSRYSSSSSQAYHFRKRDMRGDQSGKPIHLVRAYSSHGRRRNNCYESLSHYTILMNKYILLIVSLLTIGFTTLVSIPDSPYLIWGYTQADISSKFATSVTPAGFTFAIWSLIYLSWIVAGLVVAWAPATRLTKRYLPKLAAAIADPRIRTRDALLFSLAIGLTGVWLIPWGYLWIGTSLVVMLAIVSLLAYVFSRTRSSGVIVRSSIELTLGWIIMATALNITIWFRYMGWDIWGPTDLYYAIGALGIILLIVCELQCRYKTYIISGVFLWTMSGEWFAHTLFEQRVAVTIYSITLCIYIWNSMHGKSTSLKSMKFW